MKQKNILFIIDAQNDFCSNGGTLLCENYNSAVANIVELIKTDKFSKIILTMDEHGEDYLKTTEGKHLPVKHCIVNTWGHLINKRIYDALYYYAWESYTKNKFMLPLQTFIEIDNNFINNSEYTNCNIYVCGFATDICVLNNVIMLKNISHYDNEVYVIEKCCAGTTKESHESAIEIMKKNQINIIYD